MMAPQRREGGDGARGHDAAADGGQRQRCGAWSTRQCVAASDEPVGSLMVETDAERGATPMAHGWGEQRVRKPVVRVAIHPGTCEVPDDEAETCEGMRVWELPC
jgi:hypothetical protein